MNRRKKQKTSVPPDYGYMLPGDEDAVRILALTIGQITAIREYPSVRHLETAYLEASAHGNIVIYRRNAPHLTNDLAAFTALFIPYYRGGYQDASQRLLDGTWNASENKHQLETTDIKITLATVGKAYMQHLPTIKRQMKEWGLEPCS